MNGVKERNLSRSGLAPGPNIHSNIQPKLNQPRQSNIEESSRYSNPEPNSLEDVILKLTSELSKAQAELANRQKNDAQNIESDPEANSNETNANSESKTEADRKNWKILTNISRANSIVNTKAKTPRGSRTDISSNLESKTLKNAANEYDRSSKPIANLDQMTQSTNSEKSLNEMLFLDQNPTQKSTPLEKIQQESGDDSANNEVDEVQRNFLNNMQNNRRMTLQLAGDGDLPTGLKTKSFGKSKNKQKTKPPKTVLKKTPPQLLQISELLKKLESWHEFDQIERKMYYDNIVSKIVASGIDNSVIKEIKIGDDRPKTPESNNILESIKPFVEKMDYNRAAIQIENARHHNVTNEKLENLRLQMSTAIKAIENVGAFNNCGEISENSCSVSRTNSSTASLSSPKNAKTKQGLDETSVTILKLIASELKKLSAEVNAINVKFGAGAPRHQQNLDDNLIETSTITHTPENRAKMADQQMGLQSVRILMLDEMEKFKETLIPFIQSEIQSSVKELISEFPKQNAKTTERAQLPPTHSAKPNANLENSDTAEITSMFSTLTSKINCLEDKIDFLDKKFDLEKTANATKQNQIKNLSVRSDLILTGLGTLDENMTTMFRKLLSVIVDDCEDEDEQDYENNV